MQTTTLRMGKLMPFLVCMLLSLFPYLSQAQTDYTPLIQTYLQDQADEGGFQASDLMNWVITDQFNTRHNGLTHVHIRQSHQGIEVFHGVANFTIRNGQVVHMADRLERNIGQRVQQSSPGLNPAQAILAAAQALELPQPQGVTQLNNPSLHTYLFSKGQLSAEDIPVKLMYFPGPEGQIHLVWDVSIYQKDHQHWWSVRVDAQSGKLWDKIDWVTHCNFPGHSHKPHRHTHAMPLAKSHQVMAGDQYRVYPYYTESPNHGPRVLVIDPADSIASPFGWHDTNGQTGAEFTITRGNNVYASEDRDANNVPGFSPDGGANLDFDFALNLNQPPANYEDVAVTNLFYMNNVMHDMWYQYGFDEQAGNFQVNNYGNGGVGSDEVNADAQDGGGTNNANFGTPPDGSNPRMQMFLWTGAGAVQALSINPPSTIAGAYSTTGATFGPGLPATALTADIVIVNDGAGADPEDACDPILNGAAVNGKIALINRGNCNFVNKVQEAQNAGAVAVIIVNNNAGAPITMNGTSTTITIPSIMISQADGNLIKAQINANNTVNATIQNPAGANFDRDGDFDNVIIAHEYGHGISIRLTGGPSTSGCLSNAEQMGEGWSDYFGIMMTLDTNMLDRGIGTFAVGQSTTGNGIRPARYSPDSTINDFTYAATNNVGAISQPHGIGFVWCTMLWDLSLALIDKYGYDPDLYYGTGGNNIAMQLVIDGIKLQPCSPGFVDGRDAIILADQINNGGANECLIWEVFAKRGLGFSADQGSSNSRTDQVEAFDLPNQCMIPTLPPIAAFALDDGVGCGDEIFFTDQSTQIAQSWFWDFGDGTTDTLQNPSHLYLSGGVYTVTLIVSNILGSDTVSQTVAISLPPAPIVNDTLTCPGTSTVLSAASPGIYSWYDLNNVLLDTGQFFQTPVINGPTSFIVGEEIPSPIQFGGPVNGSIGPGGYHNTGFTGTINFTAFSKFTLISVWVDAGSAGTRTIFLWNGENASGSVVDQVTVNIPSGPQRVQLNLEIPGPGTYSVGGTSINLFRNSSGANYPYQVAGVFSMISSSATTNPQAFYYYLYDWEVQGPSCPSERDTVVVNLADPSFVSTYDSTNGNYTFTPNTPLSGNWLWDFGDGTTSTDPNPVYNYGAIGNFIVSLTIDGICSSQDTVFVDCNAAFEALYDSTTGVFTFNDLSIGSYSWNWDFGDGTTAQNQTGVHTYNSLGTFPVTLTINGLCSITDSVTVSCDALFESVYDSTSGEFTFNDLSQGAYNWTWDFGDGTGTQTQAAAHTYTSLGTFVVTLTVNGLCSFTDTVTFSCDANFSVAFDSLTNEFSFTDLSQGSYSWLWDFGDGTTSTLQNPTHTYAVQGSYPVSLTVNGLCDLQDTVAYERTNTSIGSLAENLSVVLQPNPADEEVWLVLSRALSHEVSMTLYNLEGQRVLDSQLLPGETRRKLDIQSLAEGIYYLHLRQGQNWQSLKLRVE
ncbi:MAG: T9SS-dependent M36 family metallopeptidase [Bacteroidota bacterium]